MKKKLDPREAPKGYRAYEYDRTTHHCGACAFRFGSEKCFASPCNPDERKDRCGVHFGKLPSPKATFAQHWRAETARIVRVGGIHWGPETGEKLARRAWNAGRRSAK